MSRMIAIYYLHLPSHFPHLYFTERINQTVEILKHTVDIEEKGVKLKLTIVDTPGFGDAVNNIQRYVFVMPMVISLQKRQACGTVSKEQDDRRFQNSEWWILFSSSMDLKGNISKLG